MYIRPLCCRRLILATVVGLTCTHFVTASDEPTLTKEQIKQFLLTAKVVKSEQAKKGITQTLRLTLSDGTLTHDASFQKIDEHKPRMELAGGTERALSILTNTTSLLISWLSCLAWTTSCRYMSSANGKAIRARSVGGCR